MDSGALGITLIVLYFAPVVVAAIREHRQVLAIGVLNLFLGWTLVGWVIALVWACLAKEERQVAGPAVQPVQQPSPAAMVSPAVSDQMGNDVSIAPKRVSAGYDPQKTWIVAAAALVAFISLGAVFVNYRLDQTAKTEAVDKPAYLSTPAKLMSFCAVATTRAKRAFIGASSIDPVIGDTPLLNLGPEGAVVTCYIKSPTKFGWMSVRGICPDIFDGRCMEVMTVAVGGELLKPR